MTTLIEYLKSNPTYVYTYDRDSTLYPDTAAGWAEVFTDMDWDDIMIDHPEVTYPTAPGYYLESNDVWYWEDTGLVERVLNRQD